jgi:hypothetical protein
METPDVTPSDEPASGAATDGDPHPEVPRDVQAEAVQDLLGALAYGELCAFQRLAADSGLAPTLADRAQLAVMAGAAVGHYEQLTEHLLAMGVDAQAAMAPFVEPVDTFHDLTQPSSWLEGLVKAYVGDGIARDFYREVATYLGDEPTRKLVADVVEGGDPAAFVVERVRAAIAADGAIAGRLALWARRLVGEALTQTQRAAVERDALIDLVSERGDLSELLALMSRVTASHEARMEALGLAS